MKYKVTEGAEYGGLGQHFKDRFAVKRTDTTVDNTVAFLLTEAEANIIAFALNAIADGKALGSPWPPTPDDGMYRYGGMYDGPTEGVAP